MEIPFLFDNIASVLFLGETNVFTGGYLGACNNHYFPVGTFSFEVHHEGDDGWCMQSVILKLDDGWTHTCSPDVFLDDGDYWTCDVE